MENIFSSIFIDGLLDCPWWLVAFCLLEGDGDPQMVLCHFMNAGSVVGVP